MNLQNYKYKVQKPHNSRVEEIPEDSQFVCGESLNEKQGGAQIKVKERKNRKKKSQQNEGLRIARQKKTEYLFRNICNPDGAMTIESLGRALAKHKIQFDLSELQEMMALCSPDSNQPKTSFPSEEILERMKSKQVKYEEFRQFYIQKF